MAQPTQDESRSPTRLKTAQDYLDFLALRYAKLSTPSTLGPNATAEEKASDNERRLTDPRTKHRRIFSSWPRDPKGKILVPESSQLGKRTPSGLDFWGETLFDFYHVRRIPDVESLVTISTGSKMREWVNNNGEGAFEGAREQVKRAERETAPKEVKPYPVLKLLTEGPAVEDTGKQNTGNIFALAEPFSQTNPAPQLQDRIPYHLLPQTLIVHDPFGALHTASPTSPYKTRRYPSSKPWSTHPDVPKRYRLHLFPSGEAKIEREHMLRTIREKYDEHLFMMFMANPTAAGRPEGRGVMMVEKGTKIGLCKPAVYFSHPRRPEREGKRVVQEAHLYLDPSRLTGKGNHSVVYDVEWEVPMSLLVDEDEEEWVMCKECVVQKGTEILEEEDGKKGEKRDAKWDQLTGKVVETTVKDEGFSISVLEEDGSGEVKDENGDVVVFGIEPPSTKVSRHYEGPVRVVSVPVAYQSIYSSALCAHLQHKRASKPAPTAYLRVVAKLSLPRDDHLDHEARIYQDFPEHLSTHYSGYHVLAPLVDPVPATAVVPQFYGYYVPVVDKDAKGEADGSEAKSKREGKKREKAKEEAHNYGATGTGSGSEDDGAEVEDEDVESDDEERQDREFKSPIMLIESCGTPICSIIEEMSIDDRQECASLFYRLHQAGFFQGSSYTRNVLFQTGPLRFHPSSRSFTGAKRLAPTSKRDEGEGTNTSEDIDGANATPITASSFRLIDFGRTEEVKGGNVRGAEETRVARMFKILHFS